MDPSSKDRTTCEVLAMIQYLTQLVIHMFFYLLHSALCDTAVKRCMQQHHKRFKLLCFFYFSITSNGNLAEHNQQSHTKILI